ncbi:MAG: LamG-like jellyroll fold domain-containing protein [Pirellulales bacterium]
MNASSPAADDLAYILAQLVEGDLDEQQTAALVDRLADDEAAQQEYLRFMLCQAMLDRELRRSRSVQQLQELLGGADSPMTELADGRLTRAWYWVVDGVSQPLSLAMLVSSLVITTILLSLALWTIPERQQAVGDGRPVVVAEITTTQYARWDAASEGNAKNLELFAGERLVLGSGLAEVTFADGAVVVLEGPCEFLIESSSAGRLDSGGLRATVPPAATGFAIASPFARIVDLGTEFGVEVHSGGDVDVMVFDGKVDCIPLPEAGRGAARVQLVGGQSARVASNGEQVTVQENGDAEVAAAWKKRTTIQRPVAKSSAGSREALAKLRADPALIALFDFESADPSIGSFRKVRGRWSDSVAADFSLGGDFIAVNVGGERTWPQLSLAAWVRLEPLDQDYRAIFHCDGWDENNPGQVHWMITGDAKMRLALSGQQHVDSQTPLIEQHGRWLHVAAVHDADQRTIRFYVNGALDHELELAAAHPARLGPARIGNWDQGERWLGGRMDELIILGRAMSGDEVQALFAAGNPK